LPQNANYRDLNLRSFSQEEQRVFKDRVSVIVSAGFSREVEGSLGSGGLARGEIEESVAASLLPLRLGMKRRQNVK
jgi:hypothetical protein